MTSEEHRCICLKTKGFGVWFVCARTDPHPDDPGSSEGHQWARVDEETWQVALAAWATATRALTPSRMSGSGKS